MKFEVIADPQEPPKEQPTIKVFLRQSAMSGFPKLYVDVGTGPIQVAYLKDELVTTGLSGREQSMLREAGFAVRGGCLQHI